MTPLFRCEHAQVPEVVLSDTLRIAHNLLSECLVLLMHYLIDVAVVEIGVTNAVDAHEILNDSVSHRESTVYLLGPIVIVGHFEGVLTLCSQSLSCFRCIFVQDAMSLVFPIEV